MRTQSHRQDAEHGCHRFLSRKSICANAEHVQGKTRGGVWFLSDSWVSFKDAPTVSRDLQGRAAEARSFVAHGAQRTFDKAGKVIFSLGKIHWAAHEEHLDGEQVWTMTRSWENGSGIAAPWTILKWTTALLHCWEVISNQHLIFIFSYFWHQWAMWIGTGVIRLVQNKVAKPCTYCAVCIRYQDVGQLPLPLLDGKSKAFKLWLIRSLSTVPFKGGSSSKDDA